MSADAEVPHDVPATEPGLIRAHGLAALAMVVYSAVLGLTIGLKFHWPDFLGDTPWLTWGRLRYGHTQGIFFGWLGNAFLTFFYHAVPRLAGRPVTSRALGWLLFIVWNFLVVIPGWVLVQLGVSQPLEWAEFPVVVDVFVLHAFVLMAFQFVLPFFRRGVSELYVSAWYIIGGTVFTLFAYPVGNFVPELVPGAQGATYSGLWIHDAVGLYATPFAVAVFYFVLPTVTGRPIYSHFLSMLTFWMLFFIYPLNGTHHYIFSSIPMEAQVGAIVASVYLGMDVVLNVSNLLLSLKGSAGVVTRDVSLRFVWVSIVTYLAVSLQGSMQSLMPVNRVVHFSDWVIGHSHFAMIGFASFAAIGGLLHVWKSTAGLRYNAGAANWAFWLLAIGLFLMVLDLTLAGMVQGQLWQSETIWIESVSASQPYWISRSLAALPVLAGFGALCLAMLTGPLGHAVPAPAALETSAGAEARAWGQDLQAMAGSDHRALPWLKSAYVLTGVAGLGCFLFSFVVLAVWPNRTLEAAIAASRPTGLPGLSASELRGRAIYGREGCLNCHSQLVRATAADVLRYGPASQAWETEKEFPQLWGTRRIGPDLARESGKRSRDWHLTHLWNPRWVVPESNMPAHHWLFRGSPLEPRQEALDLVAYLDSLGRDARLAGTLQRSPSRKMDPAEEARMGIFCDCAIPRIAGPAVLLSTDLPSAELTRFELRGAALFARHCGGCHGPDGKGDGPAAVSLLPAPRDLTRTRFSDAALSRALWEGVRGSSMPGWHELPANDLRALAAHVRSLESEPPQAKSETEPALSTVGRVEAEKLYVTNCGSCHGPQGRGDGTAVGALFPKPTDFHQERPSKDYAEDVLAQGVPGTSMPPWRDRLDAAQRRLLASYIRSLFQPASSSP
jgi:cbb3-type cytochrome oxidase subunit 1/mono/diheme cytochrome c family protein